MSSVWYQSDAEGHPDEETYEQRQPEKDGAYPREPFSRYPAAGGIR